MERIRSATPIARDVQGLFNRKAASWQSKYGPNGKLRARVQQFIVRLSELSPPPRKVLDFGCGTGDIAAAIGRIGYQVTACDVAEKMLEVARATHAGTAVEWVDLEPDRVILPFEDGSFDAAVASSVFEYLDDVPQVAKELSRVLRPQGILLLTVPNPFNLVRRIEGLLQATVSKRPLPSVLDKLRRVHSYVAYLRLSRNRFAGQWWRTVLGTAHFAALAEADFSDDGWRRQAEARLILLAVKRAPAE